jgi:hypothetical protein
MSSAIYAAHLNNVQLLAQRKGGVSRAEIMDELNVTRAVAGGLIDKAELVEDKALKRGRTQVFVAAGEPVTAKQSKPVAQAVAVPADDSTGEPEDDDPIAELDAQIVDTRNALREAATKAGKHLGLWATHQALVDALRERMTELATKRMNATS